jgi:hypothetical protein
VLVIVVVILKAVIVIVADDFVLESLAGKEIDCLGDDLHHIFVRSWT